MNNTNALKIPSEAVKLFQTFIADYQKSQAPFLILTHGNPDGDAIGSALGLHLALKKIGLNSHVGCIDPVPGSFQFLKNHEDFIDDFKQTDFDTYAFIDCGDKKLTKFDGEKPRILSNDVFRLNIDHHPTNDNFGNINLVITEASSACEIVWYLLKELQVDITPDIASALLLGIYTDTGGFLHQNTTPATYLAAADLVEYGANVSRIAQNVFRSNEFKKLKLWGKVLRELHVTDEGVAIVGVHQNDYEHLGCKRTDLNGVVDLINSMPQVQYSVMLSEDEKGNVKASLRTRKDNIDVKEIAEKFGGGGHVKASGFTIPHGKLKKEVKWKIVTE